ncbi:MAG TPA: hypothetical protein VIY49_37815, partial [Bryobacteraceae bacterium]
ARGSSQFRLRANAITQADRSPHTPALSRVFSSSGVHGPGHRCFVFSKAAIRRQIKQKRRLSPNHPAGPVGKRRLNKRRLNV